MGRVQDTEELLASLERTCRALVGQIAEDPIEAERLSARIRALVDPVTELASHNGGAIGAVQRRLARLRFDLHDGPQQDVHMLAQDLRLFRDQLRPMLEGDPDQNRALGRLDDLEAQLLALDGDLRRLVTTVESPFLAPGSLPDALQGLTQAFAERTGVVPQTSLRGSVASLSDSQQIALLSLVREALSNIRRHSDAHHVQIAIEADEDGIGVQVTDDGSGFDPGPTLARAAQAGRLGLVGMHERVRMLGGTTEIRSRLGGPTIVSASLPAWSAE
jgi:signal transduction histidine kinase